MDQEMEKLKEKNRYLQTIIGKRDERETRWAVWIFGGGILWLFAIIVEIALFRIQGKCGKAVLTNEVITSKSRNSPTRYYLEYEFVYNGVTYHGSSHEEDLSRAGDGICVVYLEYAPGRNSAMKYFSSGKMNCQCQN